jgi:hypothetical protein
MDGLFLLGDHYVRVVRHDAGRVDLLIYETFDDLKKDESSAHVHDSGKLAEQMLAIVSHLRAKQ